MSAETAVLRPASTHRPTPGRSVVVCHPGKQHAYETAVGAHEYGLLQAFGTGIYLGGPGPLTWAARSIAQVAPQSAAARAASNRRRADLAGAQIASFPSELVAARLLGYLPGLGNAWRVAEYSIDRRIARWLGRLRPRPRLVHGFEGACLSTLTAARQLGAVTVLDVPNAHERARRVLEAEGAWNVPAAVTERVRAERRLADWLLAPSEAVRDCLAENGVPPEKIVLLPYGVNPGLFDGSTARRERAPFRALYVGQISRRKGVQFLLRAWEGAKLKDAELVLVGGPAKDGEDLFRRPGSSLRWVGPVAHARLPDIFRDADVFVFPSLAEGSALVTYEAMASGLPLIVTRDAGAVARDGVDAIVVPPRDADAIGDALSCLYADPNGAREMGRRGRELILERFTWSCYRARLADFYREVLS